MEDSIEDYIKISRNSAEEPIGFTKKDVHIKALRKKECDTRAMKIVEFSIEGKLRREIFTKCLPYISQSHYQDIVEERAVSKLCGYSVCGKRIPEMPKKQYYISTKSNKVYDITDRKNYCSNYCYKASIHIKKQIDDTSLWLRKLDDIPEYQFLESTDSGLPGEYIDQGIIKATVANKFTPISTFTEVSLQDMVDKEKGIPNSIRKGLNRKLSKALKSKMQTINENIEQIQEDEEEFSLSSLKQHNTSFCSKERNETPHPSRHKDLPVIEETDEIETNCRSTETFNSMSTSGRSSNLKKPKKRTTKTQKIDIESLIKRSIKEWFTIESYIFIFGEEKIKEILNEKKLGDYFNKLNIAELKREQQIRYMEICKRLHLQEMADEKFDKALLGNSKLMPVPDYQKLKEESKELSIKVKSFYSGVLQEKEDNNFPTKKLCKEAEISLDEPPAVLPLVDANSQTALRRKIFLTSINKSMQLLMLGLRIPSITPILSDLQNLVKTFRLNANNIMFKPFVWNCVAVVFLHILSIRDEHIRTILEDKSSKEFSDLFVGTLPNKEEFLNEIMNNIKKIDSFVEEYISSC